MNAQWTVAYDHTLSTLTCVHVNTRGYHRREFDDPWSFFFDEHGAVIAVRLDEASRVRSLVPLSGLVPEQVISTARYVYDVARETRTDMVVATRATDLGR